MQLAILYLVASVLAYVLSFWLVYSQIPRGMPRKATAIVLGIVGHAVVSAIYVTAEAALYVFYLN